MEPSYADLKVYEAKFPPIYDKIMQEREEHMIERKQVFILSFISVSF